jgi:hypothetical protein
MRIFLVVSVAKQEKDDEKEPEREVFLEFRPAFYMKIPAWNGYLSAKNG